MRPRLNRLGIVVAAAIVQLAVLVLAHDLVYLARYGSRYGEALVHAGHGGAWQAAVGSTLVLGGIAAIVALARLAVLHLQLRGRPSSGDRRALDGRSLVRTWLRIAPTLALTTVALLALQENIEQIAVHGTSAGIGILLTPEYAGGLWIALAVGLAIGAVVALVAWRINVLSDRVRIALAGATRPRPAASPRPRIAVERPVASILGRRSALRAPPVAATFA